MNWTAIGIEHVGTSDRMVLGNHAQMRSSLRLTLWLMQRYDINVGNVIGHAETLESPLPPRAVPRVAVLDPRRLPPLGHA